MQYIDELIEIVYKNREISIDDIDKLNLTPDEYATLIDTLESKNIKVNMLEETSSEYGDFYADSSVAMYLNEISKYPKLSREEERDLFIQYKNGDNKAKDKIVTSNLRLVADIAQKYINTRNHSFINFLDLVQEGNLALMKESIDKFDVSKGYRFYTYASWWIRQYIIRFIMGKMNTIRIPYDASDLRRNIRIFEENYYKVNGENPPDFITEESLGLPRNKVEKIKANDTRCISMSTPVEEYIQMPLLGHISSEELEESLYEFIPSDEEIDKTVISDISYNNLIEAMNKYLNEREIKAIMLRAGLVDGKRYTMKEIGKEIGVGRQRVHQIINRAANKLLPFIQKYMPDELDSSEIEKIKQRSKRKKK